MVINLFLQDRPWKQAAQATGLHYHQRNQPVWEDGRKRNVWKYSVSGDMGGVRVVASNMEPETDSVDSRESFWASGGSATRFEATSDAIPRSLELSKEGIFRGVKRMAMGEDMQIGDPPFDDKLRIAGAQEEVFALFDARTRGLLARTVGEGLCKVGDGTVYLFKTGVPLSGDKLIERIRTVAQVAQALRLDPASIPSRLQHNADNDPAPEFRDKCRRILALRGGAAPPAEDPRMQALRSGDPAVALAAARELGPVGLPVAINIANHAGVDPAIRGDALRHAALTLPRDEGIQLLESHVHTPGVPQIVAIEGLGYLQHPGAPHLYAQIIAGGNPQLCVSVATGLMYLARPDTEELGLRLLEHPDSNVCLAAAGLLARIGGDQSMRALQNASMSRFPSGSPQSQQVVAYANQVFARLSG